MARSNKKKTIDKKDLHKKTKEELLEVLKEAQAQWVKLRMDLKMGKLKDVHLPIKKRRQIARIKTIIRKKELEK